LSRDRLLESFGRRIELHERSIVQDRNGLQQGIRKHLEIHGVRFLGKVIKLESTLEAVVSRRAARLNECLIQMQERVRARMGIEDQSVANASSRFEDGVWRQLRHAEEVSHQNLTGLREGTRKYLAWRDERFRRWAVTLQGAIEKAFGDRQRLLDTSATLLDERLRGSQEEGDRALRQRTSELLAVFARAIDGRQNSLKLKISRFGLAQYDRILDQTLRNLEEKSKRLSALSPEQLLARGYSITRDEEGRVIRSADQVQEGQTVHTQLAAGSLTSVVTRKAGSEDE
jgi:exodeoxyribonuclease VII large subunit